MFFSKRREIYTFIQTQLNNTTSGGAFPTGEKQIINFSYTTVKQRILSHFNWQDVDVIVIYD